MLQARVTPLTRSLACARCPDSLYVELLLIGLLCLFGAALVVHETARVQQFFIRLRGRGAPEDAPVFMGFVRGGNAIALRWLETLYVRRNGSCLRLCAQRLRLLLGGGC